MKLTIRELRSAHEAQLSHAEIHSVLRDTLRARHPGMWVYLEDVYEDRVVYNVEPKGGGPEAPAGLLYYQVPYLIDDAGVVTLGDSAQVERRVIYVPVSQPTGEAAGADVAESGLYELTEATDPSVGGGVDRAKIPAADHAGKNRSFPIVTPQDVADAARSIGRAGPDNYDAATLKANIIRIARRKGPAFVARLPKAWQAGASEAVEVHGDLVPVQEAQGQRREVKLIAPGWSTSRYWPAEVLERDAPDAWPAGTHMYLDHADEEAADEARSVRDLAATLATPAVYKADGSHGPGVYAEAVIAEPYVELIDALADDIGVSVNAWADTPVGEAEGKRGPIVQSIGSSESYPLTSVDFVSKAGAAGRVLQVMESLRGKVPSPTPTTAPHTGATTGSAEAAAPQGKDSTVNENEKLQEQLEAAGKRTAELEAENAGLKTENAQLREHVAFTEAGAVVTAKLGESALPEITRARMTEALVKGAVLGEDGKLDKAALEATVAAAIADETAYLARLAESGSVRDQGEGSVADALHKLKESFKHRYLAEGMSEEQAEQMAAHAAAGR